MKIKTITEVRPTVTVTENEIKALLTKLIEKKTGKKVDNIDTDMGQASFVMVATLATETTEAEVEIDKTI